MLIAQRSSKSSIDRLDLYGFDPTFIYSDGGSAVHFYCKMNLAND